MRLLEKLGRNSTDSRLPNDFEMRDIEEEKLEELAEEKAASDLKADPDFEAPEIDLEPPNDLALN